MPLGFPGDQGQALAYYAAYMMHQQQRLAEQHQQALPQALMAGLTEPGGTQALLAALCANAGDASKAERGVVDAPGPRSGGAAALRAAGGVLLDTLQASKSSQGDLNRSGDKEAAQRVAECALRRGFSAAVSGRRACVESLSLQRFSKLLGSAYVMGEQGVTMHDGIIYESMFLASEPGGPDLSAAERASACY